ncbi:MAG TPA: hypothetical protein DCZ94_05050 [Lentisphaeria bacterium]|nr:MAG: hypothetical protein A2X48_07760 [Lentisphaerae bacterium GWF2_49_21]HBC86305.1 hypothetical protein [Lentisphaeria bacterium]
MESNDMKSKILVPLGGLFSILFGLLVLLMTLIDAYYAIASSSWPHASARILDSRVQKEELKNTDKNDDRVRFIYNAEVKYSYKADGVDYEGTSIRFAAIGTGDLPFVESFIKKYPAGSETIAYYNPKDPKIAVLEPGIHKRNVMGISAGIILLVVGILIILFRNHLAVTRA